MIEKLYINKGIARTILPNRSLSGELVDEEKLNSHHDIIKHTMFNIACGGYNPYNTTDLETLEEDCYNRIHESEDYLIINGDNEFNILGMLSSSTIRYNLNNAIKEFNPYYIISSNEKLDISNYYGTRLVYSEHVPSNTIILSPYITDDILEFVISEDIKKDVYTIRNNDKEYIEYHEWIAIEFHNVNRFIKVILSDNETTRCES